MYHRSRAQIAPARGALVHVTATRFSAAPASSCPTRTRAAVLTCAVALLSLVVCDSGTSVDEDDWLTLTGAQLLGEWQTPPDTVSRNVRYMSVLRNDTNMARSNMVFMTANQYGFYRYIRDIELLDSVSRATLNTVREVGSWGIDEVTVAKNIGTRFIVFGPDTVVTLQANGDTLRVEYPKGLYGLPEYYNVISRVLDGRLQMREGSPWPVTNEYVRP